jgi:uroporphyrinogen-III synthase
MQVVLTRPAEQASVWQQALQAVGCVVRLFPLIVTTDVVTPRACQALAQAWQVAALSNGSVRQGESLGRWDHIMFVSVNARAHFLQGRPAPTQPSYWATGAGTVAALQAAGVPLERIFSPADDAAQMDSEHLWQMVQKPAQGHSLVRPGQRLLIVRGSDDVHTEVPTGRNWLAEQAMGAGLHVQEVAAYVRRAPAFTPAQLSWLQSGVARQSTWVFSSSQALSHLPQDIAWQGIPALATHPRIAQVAQERGFAVQVCLPDVDAVIRALKNESC